MKSAPTVPTEEVIILSFPFDIRLGDRPNEVVVSVSRDAHGISGIPLPEVRVDDDTRVFGEGPDGEDLLDAVQRAAYRGALEAFIRGRVQATSGRRPTRY